MDPKNSQSATASRPLVAVCSDYSMKGRHQVHSVGDKYIRAVLEAADADAVIIPAISSSSAIDRLLGSVNGVVLTGSYSNVHPGNYGAKIVNGDLLLDRSRDAVTLQLIPKALRRGIPILGVCRGMQEMNVALGGTLHQLLGALPEYQNHKEDSGDDLPTQFGAARTVNLSSDGLLASFGGSLQPMVNSLHGQGIDKLAPGLMVEATAEDGLIEAFRDGEPDQFALAVQWHPEWQPLENPFYAAIWAAFGDACREKAAQCR